MTGCRSVTGRDAILMSWRRCTTLWAVPMPVLEFEVAFAAYEPVLEVTARDVQNHSTDRRQFLKVSFVGSPPDQSVIIPVTELRISHLPVASHLSVASNASSAASRQAVAAMTYDSAGSPDPSRSSTREERP